VLRDGGYTTSDKDEAVGELARRGAPVVAKLVPLLDEAQARGWALGALALIGPDAEAALPRLARLLREGEIGNWTAHVMANVGAPAIPFLLAALDDAVADVRRRAADALGDFDARDDVASALAARLADTDPTVRRTAAAALGRHAASPVIAVRALLSALDDADEGVRYDAAAMLGKYGAAATPAVGGLVAAASCGNDSVRRAALNALAEIGPAASDALPRLLALARAASDDYAWSGAAIEAVARIGPESLAALVRDEDAVVRVMAMRRIAECEMKAPALVAAMRTHLDDPDFEARKFAIRTILANGALAEDVPELRASLAVGDPEVRAGAAHALGMVSSPSEDVVRDLARALADTGEYVRQAAAESLGKLKSSPAVALPALVRALDDKGFNVAATAATAIGAFGEAAREVAPDLRRATACGDGWVEFRAAEALLAIERSSSVGVQTATRLLLHENGSIRREAVRLLGAAGGRVSIPDLVARLDDKAAGVRVAAANALSAFGAAAAPAAEALEKMTRARDAVEAATARMALEMIRAAR
jgi:HEAT repeat protein